MRLSKNLVSGVCFAALCGLAASAASATSYDFNVNYFGNNVVTLGAGDDPVGTMLSPGDTFTYTLTGVNGVFSTTTGGSIFPFLALGIAEPGHRTSDFSLVLSYLGSPVFSFANVEDNSEVHLGTNTITLPGSLVFDTIKLTDNIVSTTDLNGDPTTTTVNGLGPIFGTPDQTPFYPGIVFYSANAVPEPASWAMMIVGLGAVGGVLRSRRKASLSFR